MHKYGCRLLPQVLDYLSDSAPGRPYAKIPRLAISLSQGFQEMTVKDVVCVVDTGCDGPQ